MTGAGSYHLACIAMHDLGQRCPHLSQQCFRRDVDCATGFGLKHVTRSLSDSIRTSRALASSGGQPEA